MSAAGSAVRVGMLERVTSSTAFAVLLVCSGLVLGPFLLFGLATLPMLLAAAIASMRPEVWALALCPIGGLAGVIGLFLTWRPPETLAGYRIMMLCIVLGVATAIGIAGDLIGNASSGDLFNVVGLSVLTIAVLAALGRVARIRRLRAAAEGRPQDALPLIFLAVALVEAGCAIAIGTQLAMG